MELPANTPLAARVPPRSAATVVLLRAGVAGLELLLMRRGSTAANFSGAFVFPGGMLERSDAQPRAVRHVIGIEAAEADRRLEVSADALGYWVAVVRECYEEAGILLALDAHRQPLSTQRLASLAPYRAALNARQLSFLDLLEREELLIPAHQIAYMAHWITPPTQLRRFDTRFFVAIAPAEQAAQHDNAELVESQWLSPAAVRQRVEYEQMNVALPTQTLVELMGQHASPESALAQAQAMVRVPTVRPCRAEGREGPKVFRLGEAPYAEIHWTDPDETGATTYELLADVPKRLDRYVTRIVAPNASYMTGPGTNTYLVGERDIAVIDPGPDDPVHLRTLIEAGAGRIRWILLTHTHPDHAPAAAALRAATGARIAGRAGAQGAEHNISVEFDRILSEGDTVSLEGCALQTVHTPGHASNHLCYLLSPTRMLFSGDHIVQGFTVVIAPPDGNMRHYLQSLERLMAIDPAILAPGHGYLIANPTDEAARLIAHRLKREAKVRGAVTRAGGRATLATLLPQVYDDVSPALYPVATLSLQAHLEKLLADGELVHHEDQWVQLRPHH